jgi:hypothetical protein
VAERLTSKCEALSSNPSAAKKKKVLFIHTFSLLSSSLTFLFSAELIKFTLVLFFSSRVWKLTFFSKEFPYKFDRYA